MSQTQLAATVAVARSAVAQWEQLNGPRPTNSHMAKIAVCCNVSYEWLTTGRGAIIADTDDPGTMALDIELHLYARDDLEKRLLNCFRELEYPGNQGLVELVETLTQKNARTNLSANARRKPLRKIISS
jgi:transcriptional regulator with XRE-family HTH domain